MKLSLNVSKYLFGALLGLGAGTGCGEDTPPLDTGALTGQSPADGGTTGANMGETTGPQSGTAGTAAGTTTGITAAPTGTSAVTTGATTAGPSVGTSAGTTAGTTAGPESEGLPEGQAYGEWTWVEPEGALCRDGSPAGYYYRVGTSPNIHMYLNGGGACADAFFCGLNPANVERDLPHERLINATGALLAGPDYARQQPPDAGIFKKDPKNPVSDWTSIYVPYCTGDVHAGTQKDVTVPGYEGKNQFVGYLNIGLILDSYGHHFPNTEKVLLTGSSAGSFGAIMNFDRVQTFWDQYGAEVHVIGDSGIPMRDSATADADYMAPCLAKTWRELWGLNEWLPEECTDCFHEDGGGLTQALGTYMFHEKYGNRVLGGFISSVEDNVMRGFFGAGGNPTDPASNCENTDPGLNVVLEATLGSNYSPQAYHDGLRDVVNSLVGAENIGYFAMPGDKHMHLWRDRFYTNETELSMTMAEFVADVIEGKPTHVGAL